MSLLDAAPTESTPDIETEGDPDALLLQRIAKGDRIALGELYCRTSAPLRGLAASILSDPCEAEDVIQDVFVVIWNRATLFDAGRGSAFAWLSSVTRRRAIDRWRTRARQASVPEAFIAEHTAYLDESFGASAKARSMNGDDYRVLRCAVAALPAGMRTVVELIFFEGLTHAEVAGRIGEPLGTIKARARRGLLRLRTLLRRVGFEQIERFDPVIDDSASATES